VFLVGGTLDSEEMAGDIWYADTETLSVWRKVPLSADIAPKRVLAATYSYADGRLWFLDEAPLSKNLRKARLVRVDPHTGAGDVVAEWPRLKVFDRHWLALDRDGALLLVASSSKMNHHVIVRLDTHGATFAVEGIRKANGRLLSAPVVDADGYSFVLDKLGNQPVRTLRLRGLEAKPGHWNDLAGCF